MKDQELILRFLAFYTEGSDNYRSPMKDFLSSFSRKNRRISDEKSNEMFKLFKRTIVTARRTLGVKAFKPERNLNAAVYDAVMVGLARRLREERKPNEDSVRASYRKLLDNEEFKSAYSRSTADEGNVRKRHTLAIRAFAVAQ